MTKPPRKLPAARRLLADRISVWVAPRLASVDRRSGLLAPLYAELRQAVLGHRGGSGRRGTESQPPAWLDGIELVTEVDATVSQWEHDGSGAGFPTVNRLTRISTRSWRPEDVDTVVGMADTLHAWARHYEALTTARPKFLPNPCPRCNESHAFRELDGERVRVPALQVTVERCVCLACRSEWPESQFMFLARTLGYSPPAGVSW